MVFFACSLTGSAGTPDWIHTLGSFARIPKANPESPVSKFATGDLETLKTKPESEGKSLVKALQDCPLVHALQLQPLL